MESRKLLRDPEIIPDNRTLAVSLGEDIFKVYEVLKGLVENDLGLNMEWRYYNDGKAWLCKVTNGKKTVFWLSAWEGLLKTSFYFTEKTRHGIAGLQIDGKIKETFGEAIPSGKLIPLILDIDRDEQLSDLKKIAIYKVSL